LGLEKGADVGTVAKEEVARRISKLAVIALAVSLGAPAFVALALVGSALGLEDPSGILEVAGVLVLLTCPVGLALGVAAWVRISRRSDDLSGKPLAILATAISALTTLAGVCLVAFFVTVVVPFFSA